MIIYALLDPRDGAVRYVGKTHRTAQRRLRRHLAPCYLAEPTHKARWLRVLVRLGLEPSIVVLETCDDPDALCIRERFWIAHYRAAGARLTNTTAGGDGRGAQHTPEARAKIRAALLGKPKSAGHRRRSAVAQLGRTTSEATREKLRAARRRPRRPLSDDWRVNVARAKGGGPFCDQYGNRYETQKGAARALGLCAGHINAVLHGRRSQTGGYVFRFVGDLRVREWPVTP